MELMSLGDAIQRARFFIGERISITPGACELLINAYGSAEGAAETGAAALLKRHMTGDFGDMDAEDTAKQNAALEREKLDPSQAERMISSYTVGMKERTVWVITEWDRSETTILLPEEY